MIDVAAQIGALTREVTSGERDGRQTKVIVAERTYPAALDDVWDAVTNPERIPRWFLPVSGDLKPGGRYQLEGNAGGEVLSCEAPRRLEITWEFGGDVSWVEVDLDAADGGTTLTLTHSAYVETERWEQYGPGAVGVGWELGLIGLALHLASGEPVSAEAFMAWSMSPEGQSFAAASSRGWADASVAAGEDETAARAAERRTTAFYTGTEATETEATETEATETEATETEATEGDATS